MDIGKFRDLKDDSLHRIFTRCGVFLFEMPWLVKFFETCLQGIVEHPHWYPGLTKRSTFREFQAWKDRDLAGFSWPIVHWFRLVSKIAVRERLKQYLF